MFRKSEAAVNCTAASLFLNIIVKILYLFAFTETMLNNYFRTYSIKLQKRWVTPCKLSFFTDPRIPTG